MAAPDHLECWGNLGLGNRIIEKFDDETVGFSPQIALVKGCVEPHGLN